MRLITIPISHYCEKARWALDRAGLRYTEEGHAQLLHWRATRPIGGKTVPVVVDGATVLIDSTDILRYADARAPVDRKLYPTDPEQRKQVDDLEEQFDLKLGPHARRVAYHLLLPLGRKIVEPLRGHVPAWELAAFQLTFPVIVGLIRKGLKINAEKSAQSQARVLAQFDDVAKRLEGHNYLVGDQFSAADLTFAALATPLLAIAEVPVPLFPLAETPADYQALVAQLRAHPAGQFAQAMYSQHRNEGQR